MKKVISMLLCLCVIIALFPATISAASDEGNMLGISGISFHPFEWEVLRLCNIERTKHGLNSFSMIQPLQASCDVRAEELATLYSHSRPDGTDCYTAIPDELMWGSAAENIGKGQPTPEVIVDGWMNSPGHRANILNAEHEYMGVGFNPNGNCWVQMFTSRKSISSFTVSTSERKFSAKDGLENEYMTLKASDGMVSYLPLDFDAMKNSNGVYYPKIRAVNLPGFTIDESSSTPEDVEPTTPTTPETTEPDDSDGLDLTLPEVRLEENRKLIVAAIDAFDYPADFTDKALRTLVLKSATVFAPDSVFGIEAEVSEFSYTAPTASKAGHLKAKIVIKDTDETKTINVDKVIGAKTGAAAGNFADVKPDAYYAEGVKWAVEKGITTGTGATTFSPDITCTRAQIITFMWRAVGSPKYNLLPFNDVRYDDYYFQAATWANLNKMVTGGRFYPDNPCTRAETVTYLWKNAGSPDVAITTVFTDVPASADYAKAVAWAVEKGITSGTSGTTFSPDNTCTRGQIVTFLHRALGK